MDKDYINKDEVDFIKADIKKHISGNGQDKFKQHGILKIAPVNTWIKNAKTRGRPKMLCGPLWYEGSLAVLFGKPGLGKTILSNQIGIALAKGTNTDSRLINEVGAGKVLYLDFEMSADFMSTRYGDQLGLNHYDFPENLLRVEKAFSKSLNREDIEQIPDLVLKDLQDIISAYNDIKIIIIDNITYLGNDTQEARNAAVMMSQLNELKKKYGLSILVVGHPPKISDFEPIELKHLAGSAMIGNFIDSCFAIARIRNDNQSRYLKELKCRLAEEVHHSGNVINMKIEKDQDTHLLSLISDGVGDEEGNLKSLSEEERDKLRREVIHIKNSNPGFSYDDIAKAAETSKATVHRILKGI